MSIIIDLDKDIEKLRSLKSGSSLLLNGSIFTARDAAHKRIASMIANKESIPIDFKDKLIYYMGPTPARDGDPIGSCGPTSSYRMDDYIEMTMQLGIAGTIGKGTRAPFVTELIKRYKAPYFVTIGGAGAYLAKCVVSAKMMMFEELGAEAVTELVVKNFPVILGIDSDGNQSFK